MILNPGVMSWMATWLAVMGQCKTGLEDAQNTTMLAEKFHQHLAAAVLLDYLVLF